MAAAVNFILPYFLMSYNLQTSWKVPAVSYLTTFSTYSPAVFSLLRVLLFSEWSILQQYNLPNLFSYDGCLANLFVPGKAQRKHIVCCCFNQLLHKITDHFLLHFTIFSVYPIHTHCIIKAHLYLIYSIFNVTLESLNLKSQILHWDRFVQLHCHCASLHHQRILFHILDVQSNIHNDWWVFYWQYVVMRDYIT